MPDTPHTDTPAEIAHALLLVDAARLERMIGGLLHEDDRGYTLHDHTLVSLDRQLRAVVQRIWRLKEARKGEEVTKG